MKTYVKTGTVILVSVFIMVACASTGSNFNSNSYKTMAVMSSTYTTGMTVATNLYGRGLITREGYSEIVKYATEYYEVYNEAVDAFEAYLSAPGDKEPAELAMSLSLIAYNKLMAIFIKYEIGTNEPIEPWF